MKGLRTGTVFGIVDAANYFRKKVYGTKQTHPMKILFTRAKPKTETSFCL